MYHHLITRLTWIPFPFVTYAYLFRLLLLFISASETDFLLRQIYFSYFHPPRASPLGFHLYRSRNDKKNLEKQKKAMINKLWIIVVRSIEKREGVIWRRAMTLDGESDWRGGEQKRIFILCHRFFFGCFSHTFFLFMAKCVRHILCCFRDRSKCYITNNACRLISALSSELHADSTIRKTLRKFLFRLREGNFADTI